MVLSRQKRELCDKLKPYLQRYLVEEGLWNGQRIPFRCPLPSHVDNHPSATITACGYTYYCYGCEGQGDIIDLCLAHEAQKFVGVSTRESWQRAVMYLSDRYLSAGKAPIAYRPIDAVRTRGTRSSLPAVTPAQSQGNASASASSILPLISAKAAPTAMEPVEVPTNLSFPIQQKKREDERFDEIRRAGESLIHNGYGALVVVLTQMSDGKVRKDPYTCVFQTNGSSTPLHNKRYFWETLSRCWDEYGVERTAIAICLGGTNLVCIDVDVSGGKKGFISLGHLKSALGDLKPKVFEITCTRGRHFWYKIPLGTKLVNSSTLQKRLGDNFDLSGIDILAGNRFVVVPPSPGYVDFGKLQSEFTRNWKFVPRLRKSWQDMLQESISIPQTTKARTR